MILYKKDTKGKIRILEIMAIWKNLNQTSGLLDWKKTGHIKVCTAKNVGRANETSPSAQAYLERTALIKKKLREWYFATQEEAENEEVVLPMLAKSYDKEKKKVDWQNAYVQPKLDWMRCLAFIKDGKVKLMSRKGVEITTMDHIAESLINLSKDFKEWVEHIFDWELYAHWISFQENMKIIKKERKDSVNVHFHIYDIVKNTHFIDRHEEVDYKLNYLDYIQTVPTIQVKSEHEMYERHSLFLEEWYEWTMLRQWIKGYKKNWRCSQLLKVKDFIDETFTVVNVLPMDVYTKQWILICEMEDGRSFKATPKMSHEDREDLLVNADNYIGQTAEVRFFEWTDDGFPRFPICVWFRLDK